MRPFSADGDESCARSASGTAASHCSKPAASMSSNVTPSTPGAPPFVVQQVALAGERHQVLARAVLALELRHAALEHAAQQELPELALDELRQAGSVAGLRHRVQEGLQVEGDDLMEHGVLGVTGLIRGRDTSHASG